MELPFEEVVSVRFFATGENPRKRPFSALIYIRLTAYTYIVKCKKTKHGNISDFSAVQCHFRFG